MAGNGRCPHGKTQDTNNSDRNNVPRKPLEAWQIYCSLPHERLSSQGTFIQSYDCIQYNSKINFYCVQVLQASATLRYALLCQQSRLNLLHTKSPLQFNAEDPPHIYKVHLFMTYVFRTKFTRRKHKTDVPIKYWNIPEWRDVVIWVKTRIFGQNLVLIRPI